MSLMSSYWADDDVDSVQHSKSKLREMVVAYYALVDQRDLSNGVDINGIVEWMQYYGVSDMNLRVQAKYGVGFDLSILKGSGGADRSNLSPMHRISLMPTQRAAVAGGAAAAGTTTGAIGKGNKGLDLFGKLYNFYLRYDSDMLPNLAIYLDWIRDNSLEEFNAKLREKYMDDLDFSRTTSVSLVESPVNGQQEYNIRDQLPPQYSPAVLRDKLTKFYKKHEPRRPAPDFETIIDWTAREGIDELNNKLMQIYGESLIDLDGQKSSGSAFQDNDSVATGPPPGLISVRYPQQQQQQMSNYGGSNMGNFSPQTSQYAAAPPKAEPRSPAPPMMKITNHAVASPPPATRGMPEKPKPPTFLATGGPAKQSTIPPPAIMERSTPAPPKAPTPVVQLPAIMTNTYQDDEYDEPESFSYSAPPTTKQQPQQQQSSYYSQATSPKQSQPAWAQVELKQTPKSSSPPPVSKPSLPAVPLKKASSFVEPIKPNATMNMPSKIPPTSPLSALKPVELKKPELTATKVTAPLVTLKHVEPKKPLPEPPRKVSEPVEPSKPPAGGQVESKLIRNQPKGKPCSSYQLDVRAATFGVCVCGFNRISHAPAARPMSFKRKELPEPVKAPASSSSSGEPTSSDSSSTVAANDNNNNPAMSTMMSTMMGIAKKVTPPPSPTKTTSPTNKPKVIVETSRATASSSVSKPAAESDAPAASFLQRMSQRIFSMSMVPPPPSTPAENETPPPPPPPSGPEVESLSLDKKPTRFVPLFKPGESAPPAPAQAAAPLLKKQESKPKIIVEDSKAGWKKPAAAQPVEAKEVSSAEEKEEVMEQGGGGGATEGEDQYYPPPPPPAGSYDVDEELKIVVSIMDSLKAMYAKDNSGKNAPVELQQQWAGNIRASIRMQDFRLSMEPIYHQSVQRRSLEPKF